MLFSISVIFALVFALSFHLSICNAAAAEAWFGVLKEGGGGPCGFRAIARAVKGGAQHWRQVQSELIDHYKARALAIDDGNDAEKKQFEERASQLEADANEWMNDFDITYLTVIYSRFIFVWVVKDKNWAFDPSQGSRQMFDPSMMGGRDSGNEPIVIVNWWNWHFDSLRETRRLTPVSPDVDGIVLKDYNANPLQCANGQLVVGEESDLVDYEDNVWQTRLGVVSAEDSLYTVQIGDHYLAYDRTPTVHCVDDEKDSSVFRLELVGETNNFLRLGSHLTISTMEEPRRYLKKATLTEDYKEPGTDGWKQFPVYVDKLRPAARRRIFS